MWAFIHVMYLVGWGNRLGTMYTWARALVFTKNRGHRIITFEQAHKQVEHHHPQPPADTPVIEQTTPPADGSVPPGQLPPGDRSAEQVPTGGPGDRLTGVVGHRRQPGDRRGRAVAHDGENASDMGVLGAMLLVLGLTFLGVNLYMHVQGFRTKRRRR